MPAIAITDHGVAQSFPDAWHTGEGKIKLLYGCEGYFLNNIDDRICVHGPQDGDFSTEICCFDIETTGLKVAHDAITEIGAVILKDGEIVDTFQTFVDPERRLSPEDHRPDRHHRRHAARRAEAGGRAARVFGLCGRPPARCAQCGV